MDSDQQRAVSKADLCSESYSTATAEKKAQISASYEQYSGAASGSDTDITQAQASSCEGHFGDYWRSTLKTRDELTVSSEGATVISECLALTESSIVPTLKMVQGGELVELSVQFKPNSSARLVVTRLGPTNLIDNVCKITKPDGSTTSVKSANDTKTVLHETESVLLSCVRKVRPVFQDGVSYNCTDETIFSVATDGPITLMTIPRTCSTFNESVRDKQA